MRSCERLIHSWHRGSKGSWAQSAPRHWGGRRWRVDFPVVLAPEATLSIYLRTPFGRAANIASESEVGARLRRAGPGHSGPRRPTGATQPEPTTLCTTGGGGRRRTQTPLDFADSGMRHGLTVRRRRRAGPGSARAAGACFVLILAGDVRSATEGSAEINGQRDPGLSTGVQSGPKAPTAAV